VDFIRLVRSGQLAEDACGSEMSDPVSCASRYHTLTASLGALRRFGERTIDELDAVGILERPKIIERCSSRGGWRSHPRRSPRTPRLNHRKRGIAIAENGH
jgi:hypothetical protein